jgi:hypothetical protein
MFGTDELNLRGTGIALEGVFAGVSISGCLRRASLPVGREARVGMEAGRADLELTLFESSKNGSKRLEFVDLYVGE